MYRERQDPGFYAAPSQEIRVELSESALRDYLRGGRFNSVRAATPARRIPVWRKQHILVLQRGFQGRSSQVFDFDAEAFDVTVTSWRPGDRFAVPTPPVSLIVVDFDDGAYADTSVYSFLMGVLPGVALIVLATGTDPIDRIVALEMGVDDILFKPAHPRELQARVRAVLKYMPHRDTAAPGSEMTYGGIHLDLVDRAVTTERGRAKLATGEFWILHSLLEARGRPVSRRDLLHCLEAEMKMAYRDRRAVDVTINRLRKKMDIEGRDSLIRTFRGYGYCV